MKLYVCSTRLDISMTLSGIWSLVKDALEFVIARIGFAYVVIVVDIVVSCLLQGRLYIYCV